MRSVPIQREGVAACADPPFDVLSDAGDPALGRVLVVDGILDLAADVELVVEVGVALTLQARDFAFQPGLLHEPCIARCDGLGQRELVGGLADVVDGADAAVAGECRGDEAGLALVVLPHRGVHRAERCVGVDLDLVVLIALALDPSLALFDLRWQPGHVEMVQGLQAKLHVDAGAHRLRRADQDAHASGIEVVEQPLLVGGSLEVLHERDFRGGNADPEQFLLDPAIGGEAAFGLDADRAEVAEDHLPGARDRIGRAVGSVEPGRLRLAPDAMDVGDQLVELVVRLIVIARPDEPHVDRGMPAIGNDR